MIQYNFKCNWDWELPMNDEDNEFYRRTHKIHDDCCNGDHVIIVNDDLILRIMYLLFKMGKIDTYSKQLVKDIKIEFEEFFNDKIKRFEEGSWNSNHFHSIDLEGEFILEFCENYNF